MAMQYMLAEIYRLEEAAILPTGLEELTIGGRIKIFRNTLLEQMRLQKAPDGSWVLDFFHQDSYRQRFMVKFSNRADDASTLTQTDKPSPHSHIMGKLAFAASNAPAYGTLSEQDLKEACIATSRLARGSGSVTVQHLYEASTHYGYVNGRGTQYISKISSADQFCRHVLLHAFAYAYLLTIEKFEDALSRMLPREQDEEGLRQLYKDIAFFNARSFYHQPVKRDNAPTCQAWQRIADAFGISTLHQELLDQIKCAHYIFGLDEEKQARKQAAEAKEIEAARAREEAHTQAKRERREKRRDLALTIVGLLLMLASAPGAIDVVKGWI